MSKRTKIVGTYRLSPDETVQFSISIPANYPDAIAEAKATVLAMLSEELADVMRQTRGVDTKDGTP